MASIALTMNTPRPYRPATPSRLQATRLRLQEQLRQWCLDWGVADTHFQLEVRPYARGESLAAAGLPGHGWRAAGERRWAWPGAGDVLERAMRHALFGPLDADAGGGRGLAAAAAAAALRAFDPALANTPAQAGMPPKLPATGEDLVLVELKSRAEGPTVLLALVQAASDITVPGAASGLPALRGVDLDAALRRLPAQPRIEIGHTELALAELLELRPSQLVVLDHPIHKPLNLRCADCPAEVPVHLGRIGDSLAVQAARARKGASTPSKEALKMSNNSLSSHDGAGPAKPAGPHGQVQMVDLEELPSSSDGGAPVLEDRLSLFGGIKARVTAVVGHAQSSVGELLALKEGASFKLDRHVDAPIDLVVEGRVVARGQLSVLDDQFAVRVTEVIQAGAAK